MKMKLEVISQILETHELEPVLLILIRQKSQKIVGAMPFYLAFTFSETQDGGACFRETNCDTRDAAVLELFLLNCTFSKKIGKVFLAGLSANFRSFCGELYLASCEINDYNCCFFS